LIDAYYLRRARFALVSGAVAVCVGTVVAWMALSAEYRSLAASRMMRPDEAVFSEVRRALGAASVMALALLGAAVWARAQPVRAAAAMALAVPAGAVLTVALAPYGLWIDELVMAPIGWGVALVGGAAAWVWARRAQEIARVEPMVE
jgi:hypothetical protein